MKMKTAAILLDFDGTLVDSLVDLHRSVNHALGRFGRAPLDIERVRSYIGDGVRVLLARSLLGWNGTGIVAQADLEGTTRAAIEELEASRQAAIDDLLQRAAELRDPTLQEAIDAFREHYRAHLADHTRCYEGVPETLAELRELGVELAIVSNKPEAYTREIARRVSIERHFRVIVGGDTASETKPGAAPIRHALEALGGVEASAALMVGDSVNDIVAGQNAGCPTVLTTYGLADPRVVAAYGPDFTIARFEELKAIAAGRSR